MERKDDFETRRAHLQDLSDDALEARFWDLVNRIVAPLVEEARTHTSPSIERSILLRMGFSSIEAQALVKSAQEKDLLGHGVGTLVLKAAHTHGLSVREAGEAMMQGRCWDS